MTSDKGKPGIIVNALTIDVEDYFQVSALAPHFPKECWNDTPCRVGAWHQQEIGKTHGVCAGRHVGFQLPLPGALA